MHTADELARAWLQHSRTMWVGDAVAEEMRPDSGLERSWHFLRALIRQAEPSDLEFIGAGPLEDYVKRHGELAIDRIESEAQINAPFRIALGRVWIETNYLSPPVTARLVAASGGVIEPTGSIGRPPDA